MKVASIKRATDIGSVDACIVAKDGCSIFTSWWWGNGCAPVCRSCASRTTNAAVRRVAVAGEYGPLPPLYADEQGGAS